ncbi:MAG: DUF1778 domain-containing protein [Geminicoccaceae bacterium]
MARQITRSERIEARLTPEVLAMVRHAAAMEGRSLSDFVVTAAERAARQAIEEAQIVRLSAADQKLFVEALLDPPEPASAMKRAFAHHRRLVREP